MHDTTFGKRLQRIAHQMKFQIKAGSLPTIAMLVSDNFHLDAASSALARELRELRRTKPQHFEALESIESAQP